MVLRLYRTLHVFLPVIESKWFRSTHLPNIAVLGQLDPCTLAAHLPDFDVCIMPFQDVPVTRTMNAVKLYEYLAAGKPVVSRDLPEVRFLKESSGDLIAVYSSPEEFFARLVEALALRTPEMAARRQAFARQNDWSGRIDVLSQKIVEVAQETNSSNALSSGSKTRSHE